MITAIIYAAVLLGVGMMLRCNVRFLQWIFVPASIVGGLVGLLIQQWFVLAAPNNNIIAPVTSEFSSWPGTLIAVVFACMFLVGSQKSLRQSMRLASREAVVVWIIVIGQTALGLLCTWLLIQPFYDVPNSFGMLIETGFAGGHGTAAAMGAVFESPAIALENGLDLGLFMATMGLLISISTGVLYVNVAIRKGWVTLADTSSSDASTLSPQPIGFARISPSIADPLVLQLVFVGAAFGLGYLARESVAAWTQQIDSAWELSEQSRSSTEDAPSTTGDTMDEARSISANALKAKTTLSATVGDFPLFIYTLFGGLVLRKLMVLFGKQELIDTASVQRIGGIAMDFLIVSAIASLNLQALAKLAIPLGILTTAALLWTAVCLFVVARHLLPKDYWFQLGILNYGMSTGTTATGFTLLKMVDRDLDSGAADDYALAAPLSSPFIGGGMLTVALPLLVLEKIPIGVSAMAMLILTLGLVVLGRTLRPMAEK